MTNEVNTSPLTREFLSTVQKKVVFEPKSLDEAEYVVQQLQALGFRYYKPEYAAQLADSLKGSVYLDTDRTIMVSTSKAEGIFANADAFATNAYSSPSRPMSVDILHGVFAVFPRSVGEGRAALIAMTEQGVVLPEGEGGTFAMAARAVYQGLLVKEGRLSFAPAGEDLQKAKILSAAELGLGPALVMSAEQSAANAAFNEMAARMQQMSAQLKRLEDEIIPKPLEKPKAMLQLKNG